MPPIMTGDPAVDAETLYAMSPGAGYAPRTHSREGDPRFEVHSSDNPYGYGGANSMPYGIGKWLRNSAQNGAIGSVAGVVDKGLDAGPIPGALTLGVPAWLLGAGGGKLAELFGAAPGTSNTLGMLGGLAGLGLGAYTGYQRDKYRGQPYEMPGMVKQQSFLDSSLTAVLAAIAADTTLSFSDKQRLRATAQRMSDEQLDAVKELITRVGIGGVAMAIMQYAGAGWASTLAGGAAASYFGGNAVNTVGDMLGSYLNPGVPSDSHRNGFGQPYLF